MKNWRSQFISINVVEQTCDWVCLLVCFVQLKIVPSFSKLLRLVIIWRQIQIKYTLFFL